MLASAAQKMIDDSKAQTDVEARRLKLQADLSNSAFAIAQLELEMSALDRSRAGIVAALGTLSKHERKLLADAADAAVTARGYMQERAQLKAKREGILQRTAATEVERNETEERGAVLSADIKSLQADLAKAQSDSAAAIKVYRDRDDDLKSLVSAADSQRSQLLQEVKRLLLRRAELTKRLADLAAKQSALTSRKAVLEGAVEDLTKAVDVLQAEVKTQTAAADSAEKAIGAS